MDIMEFLKNQNNKNWSIINIDKDRLQLSNHEYIMKISLSSDGLSKNLKEFELSENSKIRQVVNPILATNGFVAICEYVEPFQELELTQQWFKESIKQKLFEHFGYTNEQ